MVLLALLAAGALLGVALVWRMRDLLALPIAGAVGGFLAGVALQVWAEVWPGRERGVGLLLPWFLGAILGAFLGTAVAAARRGAGRAGDGPRGAPPSDEHPNESLKLTEARSVPLGSIVHACASAA